MNDVSRLLLKQLARIKKDRQLMDAGWDIVTRDELKTAREFLLENLNGDIAFKNGRPNPATFTIV